MRERFASATQHEADRLIDELSPGGGAELRRAFAGPLAAAIVTRALGLGHGEVASVLAWYDAIVAAVTDITAGRPLPPAGAEAFAGLRARLNRVIASPSRSSLLAAAARGGSLDPDEVVSNAAVLLFGGIETTEGMIANAVLHLLEHPAALARVRADPGLVNAALEESLRLEPGPFDLDRAWSRARREVAFAHGPHVCLAVHLPGSTPARRSGGSSPGSRVCAWTPHGACLCEPGLPQATGAPRTVELTRRNPAHPGSRVLWS